MKTNSIMNNKKGSRTAWSPYKLPVKVLLLCTSILFGISTATFSQDARYEIPSWKFGLAAGANYNMYTGSTHELSTTFTPPVVFHDGSGVGLYVAPYWEYQPASSMLGVMLQAGYDNRQGAFNEVQSACNCPADLTSDLSYITIEPSLRFAPFKSGFYLFSGPRLAFNFETTFTYKLGINPAYPDQAPTPDVNGYMSSMNNMIVSMQVGAGYDIALSSKGNRTQAYFSPFVSYQPYFGQHPRSIETWSVSTVRAGAILKFGRGERIVPEQQMTTILPKEVVIDPKVTFTVNSPENIPVERRVRETFPIRNYVFFNLGSTEIPERYVLLKKSEVKDFKEDQLEVFKPKTLSGRSDREMTAYYNVLNILGDRMSKNPSTSIKLVGSSENGTTEGRIMAESVKKYLVDVFGISSSRIITEGRDKPKIPSEQPGATVELELLGQDDRRVSIESSSPELLMEFQTGEAAPLKPVEINVVQEAPLDSYITVSVAGADEAFSSWSLEVMDEEGTIQKFGPYQQENVNIPGKTILGKRPQGNYTFNMTGTTKSGKTVKKETQKHLVLWTPPTDEQGMRYSVIYEFNDSKSIKMYEKYLTEVVTPKIPKNASVIVHGYTDAIGDPENNKILSLARANNVKGIINAELTRKGRTDVKITAYGFGEDKKASPFENKLPEERFYNRTVIIDIISK